MDVRDGQQASVGAQWSDTGFINRAVRVGGRIVYSDRSDTQSDSAPAVLWREIAIDVASGRSLTLASKGDVPDPLARSCHTLR